jgi:hypothetical protein
MRGGSEGLPPGHDFACEFELTAEDAAEMLIGEDLAEAHTRGGELVVGAVADTGATLEEWAPFPGKGGENGGCWMVGVAGWGLGKSRNGSGETQGCEERSKGT